MNKAVTMAILRYINENIHGMVMLDVGLSDCVNFNITIIVIKTL